MFCFDRMVSCWLQIPELLEAPSLVTRTARRFTTWLPTFSAAVPVQLRIVIMSQVSEKFT